MAFGTSGLSGGVETKRSGFSHLSGTSGHLHVLLHPRNLTINNLWARKAPFAPPFQLHFDYLGEDMDTVDARFL